MKPPFYKTRTAGFSRTDLSAVIATLALLALIPLTTGANSRTAQQAAQCRSNLKSLGTAWLMYAVDFDGDLVDPVPVQVGGRLAPDWTGARGPTDGGWIDLPVQNDTELIPALSVGRSPLSRYLPRPTVFRCPTDPTRGVVRGNTLVSAPLAGRTLPRVRSYSLNNWLGSGGEWNQPSGRSMPRFVDVWHPDRTFNFIEEHPGSINDGMCITDMQRGGDPRNGQLVDIPANYHSSSCTISFSDGHVETWRWRTQKFLIPFLPVRELVLNTTVTNNVDLARLRSITGADR